MAVVVTVIVHRGVVRDVVFDEPNCAQEVQTFILFISI